MKLFKKTNLSLALTTALAAGALIGSQQASANADVIDGPQPMFVSNNSLGQTMIYPYYTVRDGKVSIINVFNTSDKTIAAKVRFHESHNSRDVLDFNVVLSPYDKWSGTISMGATGAIFKSRDNTCTVPQIPSTGVALNQIAYNGAGFADVDADQSTDRMNEGYVEVIAMGYAEAGDQGGFVGPYTAGDPGNSAYNSTHVNGVPRNCGAVSSSFAINSGVNAPAAVTIPMTSAAPSRGNPMAYDEYQALQPGMNPLRGALSIIGATDGVGFGTSAMAMADWNQSGDNQITAQEFPYFLEPTIASAAGVWNMALLPSVDLSLTAVKVINEWANNPINGAATDWVIQFPTKGYHVDIPYSSPGTLSGCNPGNVQAAYNHWRFNWLVDPLVAGNCDATTTAAILAPQIEPFESRFTPTGSPVTVSTTTYDKEEREGTPDGVSFSPAQPAAANALPWESNIVTFGGPSVLSSSSPELSLDPVGTIPGAESNGMAIMQFTGAAATYATPVGNALPVIGFVAKERDQGNPGTAYGQIMTHSYIRTFDNELP